MKLTFSQQITAADPGRRIIAGRIVTWDEIGNTSAGPTKFAPDSITASDAVPLCLEHDQKKPLGRSMSLQPHATGIDGQFRVVATTAGTDALVEASEGLRGGFSVGVIVDDYHYTDAGEMVVTAARLEEVSLVTRPAIDSARVETVAASETPTEKENTEMIDPTPDEVVEEVVVSDEAVEVQAAHVPTFRTAPRVAKFDGPADYVHAYVRAAQGDQNAGMRIAAANQTIADTPGLVPTPLYGNVITFLNGKRPVVAASRSIGMPSAGASFIRPKVTQHTQVAKQVKELDALASQTMKVTQNPVTKETYGGTLKITMQDAAWTDPAILNLVIQDLSAAYAVQTDTAAGAKLIAGTTKTVALAADADAKATVAAITTAAQQIASAIYEMPDTIFVSYDKWAQLASVVDTTGRQLFAFSSPMNASGSQAGAGNSMEMNVLGLRVVASANLPAGTMIVGRSELLETYETIGGQLSIQNPTTLSFDIAYYGFFASFIAEGDGFRTLKPGA